MEDGASDLNIRMDKRYFLLLLLGGIILSSSGREMKP
jgi:hypothetical protein